jgi:hypothetical protein
MQAPPTGPRLSQCGFLVTRVQRHADPQRLGLYRSDASGNVIEAGGSAEPAPPDPALGTELGRCVRSPFRQVVLLGFPRPLLSAKSTAVHADRSRALPYSHHGVERETRLELATLTLARSLSHSVFRRGRDRPLNMYLPPTATGLNADHTGVHTGHKMARLLWGRGNDACKLPSLDY